MRYRNFIWCMLVSVGVMIAHLFLGLHFGLALVLAAVGGATIGVVFPDSTGEGTEDETN